MSSPQLLSNSFKVHMANQLLESVNEVANSTYYFFQANPFISNETVPPDADDTVEETEIDVYRTMIQGKRVKQTDFALLINKNSWVSNTVYDMYEHDVDLSDSTFYVSVNEGSFLHVYKCLDNNMGLPSTVVPSFAAISGANTLFYRTSDGYAWKYMYSFSSAQDGMFSTSKYIPVIANSAVVASAEAGAIDVIKVEGTGRKYDNYLNGSFGSTDIKVGGNAFVYGLASSARDSNSFYTGCLMYLATGTGAGQWTDIIDYVSNTTGKFAVIGTAFDTAPTNGTTYQITPKVGITGTGSEVPAVARALVNASASNSVYRVEMLSHGSGYTYYATANVIANSVVGVLSPAELKVILPPSGGHGFWAESELLSNKIELSATIANSESGTLLTNNGYRQIGVLKDPYFANVVLTVANNVGPFAAGEKIYKISPQRIRGNASCLSSSNLVTVTLDAYNNNIKSGDLLWLDGNTAFQLAYVNSVVNSTTVQLTTNAFFTSSNLTVFFAEPSAFGTCYATNGTSLSVANVYGVFAQNDLVMGLASGGKMSVANVVRSGIAKGFDTFIGLTKYRGTVQSGSFVSNELGSTTFANVAVHSVVSSNTETAIYVSNQIGIINNGDTIVGANSGAQFLVSSRFGPELEFNSGEVIYLENIDRVTRSANSSETFQIIFEF